MKWTPNFENVVAPLVRRRYGLSDELHSALVNFKFDSALNVAVSSAVR